MRETTTARELLEQVRGRLSGQENAEAEAYWMLESVAGLTRTTALLHPDAEIAPAHAERILDLARRRAAGEPLQYLLGDTEFLGRRFRCDRRALIPRPDTECLVRAALELLPAEFRGYVAELGVGSGAVLVTLALERPTLRATGSDLSPEALSLAIENAERWGVRERIEFRQGDLTRALAAPVDLLLFNPPYIVTAELEALQPELSFEPRLALDGGADGLDVYRRLAAEWPGAVLSDGWCLVEVGAGMHEAVAQLLGGRETRMWRDDYGILRVVGARR